MKKIIKRIIVLLIVIAVLLMLLPVQAAKADNAAYYAYYFKWQSCYQAPLTKNIEIYLNFYMPQFITHPDDMSTDPVISMPTYAVKEIQILSSDTQINKGDVWLRPPAPWYDNRNYYFRPYGTSSWYKSPYVFNTPLSVYPNYGNYDMRPGFQTRTSLTVHDDILQKYTGYTYNNFVQCWCVVVSQVRLDLSGLEGGLIGVSDSIDKLNTSINNFKTIVQDGFGNIEQKLLDIIDAINNSSSSGGGTSAIIGAINGLNTSIGDAVSTIVAQQKASANQITSNADANQAKNEAAIELVQSAVDGVKEELVRQANANLESAKEDGGKVQGMATSLLDDVKSNWQALYFPIEFTTKIMSVFTDGTSSLAYQRSYGDVTGYTYDSKTGELHAIRSLIRAEDSERAVSGTTITLPSFTLDIPGIGSTKIWDSYSYDISDLKRQFPVFFDALYVISGIVLIYATVGFLVDLFTDLVES